MMLMLCFFFYVFNFVCVCVKPFAEDEIVIFETVNNHVISEVRRSPPSFDEAN